MKRIIYVLIMFLIGLQVNASGIDAQIRQSGINKGAVSVSVKDAQTGKTVYGLNDRQPSMPASTLKLVTLSASLDTLGENYEFATKLYKTSNNELYLKLSADPFLSSDDLKNLAETASKKNIFEPKAFYIDDFVFDNVEWGEGWQWDDDLNSLMPKFSSYNIDGNLLSVVISPTSSGAPAEIRTAKFYPVTFMNLVKTSSVNSVNLSRNNSISPDIITVEGTVQKQFIEKIPVNNPKRYFTLRLEDALRSAKLGYYGNFPSKKLPADKIYFVAEVKHPINSAVNKILHDSNNMVAETVFKSAGAKFANGTGTLENSQKMLYEYLKKSDINFDDVKIVDGSGVSKNNIVTADFMTDFLIKNKDKLKENLPTAGEGTLTNRMLYFKDNIRAKTGTLSDVSSIAGYITSRSGKTYVFDIIINDAKSKSGEKKSLEEYILREIYANY